MKTHTSGPWKIDTSWAPHSLHQLRLANSTGLSLAEVFHDIPEGQANARLIASAPELLAALELLLNQADACKEFRETFTSESRELARSAIARAAGA